MKSSAKDPMTKAIDYYIVEAKNLQSQIGDFEVQVKKLQEQVEKLQEDNETLIEIARGFVAEAKEAGRGYSSTLTQRQAGLCWLRERVELLEKVLE